MPYNAQRGGAGPSAQRSAFQPVPSTQRGGTSRDGAVPSAQRGRTSRGGAGPTAHNALRGAVQPVPNAQRVGTSRDGAGLTAHNALRGAAQPHSAQGGDFQSVPSAVRPGPSAHELRKRPRIPDEGGDGFYAPPTDPFPTNL